MAVKCFRFAYLLTCDLGTNAHTQIKSDSGTLIPSRASLILSSATLHGPVLACGLQSTLLNPTCLACGDRGKPTPHTLTCSFNTSQKDGMRAEDYMAWRSIYLSLCHITQTHTHAPALLSLHLSVTHLCPQWICSACLSTSDSAEVEIFLGKG